MVSSTCADASIRLRPALRPVLAACSALLSVADGGWRAVDETEAGAAGVAVRIVPGEMRNPGLPFAAAPRDLETLLDAPQTGLPDRRRALEAAAWASG